MLLVIVLLVGVVYSPTLLGDFVYDDHLQIEKNISIRSLTNIPEFFQHSTGYYSQSPAGYYRPLHMVAYALVYVVSRTNPLGYHALNLVLMAAVGYALFLLLQVWFSRAQAAFATLLFLVHPVHVEAVAWIAALPELVCALCVLLAFHRHLKKNWQALDYVLAGGLLLIGLLTRENALVLPILALVLDALDTKRRKNIIRDKLWVRYLVYGISIGIYFILRYQALGYLASNPDLKYPMSGDAMLLNAVYLLSQYYTALVWPPTYSAFHVFEPLTSVGEARFVGVVFVFLISALIAWYYYYKQFCVFYYMLWIPIAFLPFLYFPALGENVFVERYMFLPSIGIAVLFSALAFQLFRWHKHTFWQYFVVGCSVGSVLLGGGLSFARTLHWKDDITLCQKTLRTDPKAYHFYNLLAFAYYQAGDTLPAKKIFQSFDKMFPESKKGTAPGQVSYAAVKQLPAKYRHYKQAYFEAQAKLAALHYQLKEYDQALTIYKQLTELDSTTADQFFFLGLCYEHLGRREQARQAFQLATRINPQYTQAQRHLKKQTQAQSNEVDRLCTHAHQLVGGKNYKEAIAVLAKAAKKYPGHAKPHHYLFNVYWLTGQKEAAQAAIYQALQRDPDNQLYQFNYETLKKEK